MRASITVIGIDRVNVNLKAKSKEVYLAAYKGLATAAMKILADAKMTLKNNGSIATGQLRDSGVVERGDNYIDVDFKAEHASAVEFGRKAGSTPPIGDMVQGLQSWVMKRGLADTNTAGGNRRARGGDFFRRVRSIAFLIARSIGKKGTKAQPFLYPALRNNEHHIQSAIEAAIKKVL